MHKVKPQTKKRLIELLNYLNKYPGANRDAIICSLDYCCNAHQIDYFLSSHHEFTYKNQGRPDIGEFYFWWQESNNVFDKRAYYLTDYAKILLKKWEAENES